MAESLIGGAAVGAVFGELRKAVLEMKDKAIMFKQTLAYLRTTLIAIAPVIKEIEQHNSDLGRPKEELELLVREMEEGTKLVCKCSKIHRLNYVARVRSQEQLAALVDSLVRFFIIDMQAQTARDLKETLLEVRRIRGAVNKLPLVSTEDTSGPSSYSVPSLIGSSELTAMNEPNDDNAMETDSTEKVIHSETPELKSTQSAKDAAESNYNSIEQVMEDITSLSHKAKAKSENSQAAEHLMSEKRLARLPKIKLIHKIVGFNRQDRKDPFEPPRNIPFQDCVYNFDIEDLLHASAEVLGKTSSGTTYKAILEDGTTLVVKRLKDVVVKKKEFEQQMQIVHSLSQHPKVMPLLACYYSTDEKLLIYDYMAAGSFSKLLHDKLGITVILNLSDVILYVDTLQVDIIVDIYGERMTQNILWW